MTGLFTLAFAAGLLAPINPCGFALLPAYMATQAGTTPASDRTATARLLRGLRSGIGVSLGFGITLSAAALAVALGARPLVQVAPWLAVGVGAVLAALGLVMLVTGRGIGVRLPGIGNRSPVTGTGSTLPGAIAFGVGYALASLACTFGVLLSVTAQALAAADIASLFAVIAAYAAGAATLLITVSLTAALAGTAIAPATRALARYSGRIIGGLLTVTGIYLIAYWLPQATSGGTATGVSGPLSTSATATQTWVSNHQLLVIAAALGLTSAAIITGRRNRRPDTSAPEDCCLPSAAVQIPSPATPVAQGRQAQRP